MRLLLCCPVSVWTDLFQRWWARKKHHSGWTEFPPHFRVLCTILYEKVQGKRSSRNLAMTEIKKTQPSIQFISSLVLPYHSHHCQFSWEKRSHWGRRGFAQLHLRARAHNLKPAYTGCHFTGAFIPENYLPRWVPFTYLVEKKTLKFFPPHFSGLGGWNGVFGQWQNSHS